MKKFPAIGQPGCGTVLSLTLLEFLERLAPLIPPRRLDGAPIEIRLVLTGNIGISTKHVRKDTLGAGWKIAAKSVNKAVMVIRHRGTTGTFLRGLCLTGLLVSLGLTGIRAEKSATGGTSFDLDAVPVHSWDAASLTGQQRPGEETFRRMCAPCHGETGRGDSPAAAAFNPPPPDFTNPEGIIKLTDEEVAEVITRGRASMPAFGVILGEEVLPALVAYLRELSRGIDR